MRVRKVRLKDFRGFEDETLDLDRPLTVLIGTNGAGKTSVLDALTVVASHLVARWTNDPSRARSFTVRDLRSGVSELSVQVDAVLFGQTCVVDATHHADPARGTEIHITPGEPVAWQGLMEHIRTALARNTPVVLPLVVVYPSKRGIDPAREPAKPPDGVETWDQAMRQGAVYLDALDATETDFASFFTWFRLREDLENEERLGRGVMQHEDRELGAVRRAISTVLPEVTRIRVRRAPSGLVVQKQDAEYDVRQLAYGERTVISLVGDLARRLAMIDPVRPDPLQGEAFVMIDEVDLHLHPAWQRRIVGSLSTAFPNCQFIVSTHSPLVLSEVPTNAVVLLENFKFRSPAWPTSGRDSNSILEEVMGVSERPEGIARAFDEVRAFLDEGRFSEARARLDELKRHVTEHDTEWIRLSSELDVLERIDAPHHEGA
jgi:predicted ATP-binding protein involved in virulence